LDVWFRVAAGSPPAATLASGLGRMRYYAIDGTRAAALGLGISAAALAAACGPLPMSVPPRTSVYNVDISPQIQGTDGPHVPLRPYLRE
jgi:hypothetical protein